MSKNSCMSCPSAMTDAAMTRNYNGSLGCSYCPTTGAVLSIRRHSPEEALRLLETIAESCPSHGDPSMVPPSGGGINTEAIIAVGDPQISIKMATLGSSVPEIDKPISCTSCAWYVPSPVVQAELGYTAPLCAAKGKLMFTRNLLREAANCGSGINGVSRETTDGIILMPRYATPKQVFVASQTSKSVDHAAEASRHTVDPRQYVTDKPVTPEDDAECIRAWRQVNDPEGSKPPVFLPIYDGQKLCGFDPRDTYMSHRPDLYFDHQGLLYDLAVEFVMLHETPLLIGGAGTGKTEMSCWIAYMMDIPFTRCPVDKGTEAFYFIGETHLVVDPVSGSQITEFRPGSFIKAYSKPGVIDVDEPNLKQEIYEFLRPATDRSTSLKVDAAQGMMVERGKATYLIFTQNPADDPLYIGTEPMSAADIDRISPIYVELPSREVESRIIRTHCADDGYDIPEVILDAILDVAEDLRRMIAEGSLPIAWGLRAQIKVARKTRYYSLTKSYRRAVIDGMEDSVVQAIMGIVSSRVSS